MSELLDESYLEWLYGQVADSDVKDPRLTHWKLLRQMFQKEFAWIIPNDDNRMEDGKELRREFVRDINLDDIDPHWADLGCSFLELMVGLSRHMAFNAGGEPYYWFWRLMENIGLNDISDAKRVAKRKVDDAMDNVIWRQYEPDGSGGFFPLREPNKDQRGVELWYQLSAYVLEQSN